MTRDIAPSDSRPADGVAGRSTQPDKTLSEQAEQQSPPLSSRSESHAYFLEATKRRRGYTVEAVHEWLATSARWLLVDETLVWAEENGPALDWLISRAEQHREEGARRIPAGLLMEELRYLGDVRSCAVVWRSTLNGWFRWRERYPMKPEMEPVIARLLLLERPEWLADEFIILERLPTPTRP